MAQIEKSDKWATGIANLFSSGSTIVDKIVKEDYSSIGETVLDTASTFVDNEQTKQTLQTMGDVTK